MKRQRRKPPMNENILEALPGQAWKHEYWHQPI